MDGAAEQPSKKPTKKSPSHIRGTFEYYRKADRTAVKKHLDTFLETEKSRHVAAEDMWALLKLKMEERLAIKERNGTPTMRSMYPRQYDERVEEEWLRHAFRGVLGGEGMGWSGGGGQEDVDDDEPEPQRRVKTEADEDKGPQRPARGDSIRVQHRRPACSPVSAHLFGNTAGDAQMKPKTRTKSRLNYREDSSDEDQDEEPQKPVKPAVAVACSRSFAIRFGCAGLEALKSKVEAAKEEKVKVTAVLGTGRPIGPGAKRSWQWVDGKMVIWPPFGVEIDALDAQTSTKGKFGDDDAEESGGVAKRIKV